MSDPLVTYDIIPEPIRLSLSGIKPQEVITNGAQEIRFNPDKTLTMRDWTTGNGGIVFDLENLSSNISMEGSIFDELTVRLLLTNKVILQTTNNWIEVPIEDDRMSFVFKTLEKLRITQSFVYAFVPIKVDFTTIDNGLINVTHNNIRFVSIGSNPYPFIRLINSGVYEEITAPKVQTWDGYNNRIISLELEERVDQDARNAIGFPYTGATLSSRIRSLELEEPIDQDARDAIGFPYTGATLSSRITSLEREDAVDYDARDAIGFPYFGDTLSSRITSLETAETIDQDARNAIGFPYTGATIDTRLDALETSGSIDQDARDAIGFPYTGATIDTRLDALETSGFVDQDARDAIGFPYTGDTLDTRLDALETAETIDQDARNAIGFPYTGATLDTRQDRYENYLPINTTLNEIITNKFNRLIFRNVATDNIFVNINPSSSQVVISSPTGKVIVKNFSNGADGETTMGLNSFEFISGIYGETPYVISDCRNYFLSVDGRLDALEAVSGGEDVDLRSYVGYPTSLTPYTNIYDYFSAQVQDLYLPSTIANILGFSLSGSDLTSSIGQTITMVNGSALKTEILGGNIQISDSTNLRGLNLDTQWLQYIDNNDIAELTSTLFTFTLDSVIATELSPTSLKFHGDNPSTFAELGMNSIALPSLILSSIDAASDIFTLEMLPYKISLDSTENISTEILNYQIKVADTTNVNTITSSAIVLKQEGTTFPFSNIEKDDMTIRPNASDSSFIRGTSSLVGFGSYRGTNVIEGVISDTTHEFKVGDGDDSITIEPDRITTTKDSTGLTSMIDRAQIALTSTIDNNIGFITRNEMYIGTTDLTERMSVKKDLVSMTDTTYQTDITTSKLETKSYSTGYPRAIVDIPYQSAASILLESDAVKNAKVYADNIVSRCALTSGTAECVLESFNNSNSRCLVSQAGGPYVEMTTGGFNSSQQVLCVTSSDNYISMQTTSISAAGTYPSIFFKYQSTIAWEILGGRNRNLEFNYFDGTTWTNKGYVNDTGSNIQLNFTGAHTCNPTEIPTELGVCMYLTGQIKNLNTTLDTWERLPIVTTSGLPKQFYGIYLEKIEGSTVEFKSGIFTTSIEKTDERIWIGSHGNMGARCHAGSYEAGDVLIPNGPYLEKFLGTSLPLGVPLIRCLETSDKNSGDLLAIEL